MFEFFLYLVRLVAIVNRVLLVENTNNGGKHQQWQKANMMKKLLYHCPSGQCL
jgi:uncharacterized membrane protein